VKLLFGSGLTTALFIACSPPAIPPPVAYVAASSSADAHTAKPNPANADDKLKPPFGPFDVQTVFYIEKSNDKDHVDYGMRLDQHCAPVDENAVFPYWRELQHAPPVRSHPLTFIQYMAYGFSKQQALERGPSGGKYLIRLKQVKRPILIVTGQDRDSHCVAKAYTLVQKLNNARLDYIFVKVAGAMSADYIDVHGTNVATGETLVERLTR
jgi:hypothetical protein